MQVITQRRAVSQSMEYEYFPADFPVSGKFLETIPVGTATTAI